MKKAVIGLVLIIVVAGFCAAQTANVAQKIVGTWIDQDGATWTFRADGYLTIKDVDGDTERTQYAVTDTKMYFDDTIWDISMSPDGKTLLFSPVGDSDGYWLTKK